MNLTLYVWRQPKATANGKMVRYEARDINPDMSFLEMLDVVNWKLIDKGEEPIAFDHDCREGICGSCGMMINGIAHGPRRATAACQLHMRHFKDGDTIHIEPWRSKAFPVIKDLVVDRGSFDRIMQAGVTFPFRQEVRRKLTLFRFQSRLRIRRWTPRRASVAEPASQPVRTAQLRYLRVQRSRSLPCSRKVNPNGNNV
jgi:succinate dehydrogenase/fumarate reductase-like Fe-S protein